MSNWLDKYITVDNNGYWNPKNHGKPVKINSNQITMKGVNQPLVGVSDTGHQILMQPGQDYSFNGSSVIEYPLMQNGGDIIDDDYLDSGWYATQNHISDPNKQYNHIYDIYADTRARGANHNDAIAYLISEGTYGARARGNGAIYNGNGYDSEDINDSVNYRLLQDYNKASAPLKTFKRGGVTWLNEYQNGGQAKPIFTSDPNDPRLKAYNDSLNLYNKYPYSNTTFTQMKNNITNIQGTATNDRKQAERDFYYQINSTNDPINRQDIKLNDKHHIIYPHAFFDYALGNSYLFDKPVQPIKLLTPEVQKQQELVSKGFLQPNDVDGQWGQKSQKAWDSYQASLQQPKPEVKKQEPVKPIVQQSNNPQPQQQSTGQHHEQYPHYDSKGHLIEMQNWDYTNHDYMGQGAPQVTTTPVDENTGKPKKQLGGWLSKYH